MVWALCVSNEVFELFEQPVDNILDTVFFVTRNEQMARQVMMCLEGLSVESEITSGLTLRVDLDGINTRFQCIELPDNDELFDNIFPRDFICVEGVLNAQKQSAEQVQSMHDQTFDSDELQMIRNLFGELVV
jgi:hypothetical protein